MYRVLKAPFFILSFAVIVSSTSNAATSLEDQRKQFLKAESLLKQNKVSAYKKIRKDLDNYPLAPYLDYQRISSYMKQSNSKQIAAFLDKYPDLPISYRLNRSWLNYLAKKKRWGEYRDHFSQYPIEQTKYICHQQVAKLKSGAQHNKDALQKAKELWLVGNSQPKSCDPLFKAWMAKGFPSSADAYQRFWMSLDQGNIKLARYLNKKLKSKQHKSQAALFWSIYNDPKLISSKSITKLENEHQYITARIAYKRWYRQQPITAATTWSKKRNKIMPSSEQETVTEYMGVRLNRNYHPEAIRLSKLLDPEYNILPLTETRVRNALAQQNWEEVKRATAGLPEAEQQDPKWRYWSIIAERHLTPDDKHKLQLQQLAQDRSYYGFLAAELNQSPFKLNAVSEAIDTEQLQSLANKPAVQRAGELFKLGRLTDANREWRQALIDMDEVEKKLAGYIAKGWGWHLQAIINAAKTERWDHLELRFPHPHAKIFKQNAVKNNLDLSFPVAIARQESAFLYNAQSRVGARGLMQLMPRTAKQTAKKHKVPYKKLNQLYDPKINIALGSAYIGDMLKRFDQNPAYAAAAYNAGPHRVKKWLKQRGQLPLDIWIETIPFKETRRYVQNVLAFRVIYDRLEGRQASLLTEKQIQLLAINQSKKTAL